MSDTGNRFTAYHEATNQQRQAANAVFQIEGALATYFDLRRRQVIAELRMLDRLLGREQTIPERVR